jgi:hypothetical protein
MVWEVGSWLIPLSLLFTVGKTQVEELEIFPRSPSKLIRELQMRCVPRSLFFPWAHHSFSFPGCLSFTLAIISNLGHLFPVGGLGTTICFYYLCSHLTSEGYIGSYLLDRGEHFSLHLAFQNVWERCLTPSTRKVWMKDGCWGLPQQSLLVRRDINSDFWVFQGPAKGFFIMPSKCPLPKCPPLM